VLSVAVAKGVQSPENTHSSQFPVALIEPIIRMLCPRCGVVLDPFIGSASTAIAAIRTGRHYVGFEKEPHITPRPPSAVSGHIATRIHIETRLSRGFGRAWRCSLQAGGLRFEDVPDPTRLKRPHRTIGDPVPTVAERSGQRSPKYRAIIRIGRRGRRRARPAETWDRTSANSRSDADRRDVWRVGRADADHVLILAGLAISLL
jgi:hypothetical protein